ncbi:DUF1254 domain-containing protein [Ferrimonas balearica]|uniref:DUF1254 domain-containing protein n=1 Tax=Ferrimonas balearica TaxID=44012 RepID=UPI001C996043|nr:DUF1254 domain-containing protein [Ferrimonas balearica]MBY5921674.1 DUF1254 domain-containing protein [Ferrimonas balearica]MBY5994986.1 DUF1254 domain-containing protein [Ferrimonas balearica]
MTTKLAAIGAAVAASLTLAQPVMAASQPEATRAPTHPILQMFRVNNHEFEGMIKEADARAKEEWAYATGIQAFMFAIPMVMMDIQRDIRMNPALLERIKHTCPCAAPGEWGHYSGLATAKSKMPYTPNPDTVYSGLYAHLSDEPTILKVPDIDDRYFSIQIADAYLTNQHYIGTRATGGKGGYFALVGPDWQGTLPDGVAEMRMPNNSAIVALRIASYSNEEAEVAQVRELQKQFDAMPLSQFGMSKAERAKHPVQLDLAPTRLGQGELAFYHYLSQLLRENPPQGENRAILNSFKLIGLSDTEPFDPAKLDEPTKRGLARAMQAGIDIIKWKVKFRGTQSENKWNVDFVGGDYGTDYLARAEGAVQGLFVHSPEEAVYFHTYSDINNDLLMGGENQYVLHFDKGQLPTSYEGGFWSIALYGDDYQLVDNPIDRYAIRKSTEGLKYNDDGSLTLYLQSKAPEGWESNWLPTPPQGIFRLNMRVYLPTDEVRSWDTVEGFLPGVTPVGE